MWKLILVAMLGAPLGLSAQAAEWAAPFDPVQVADNVYYVGSAGLSAFLFTSDSGHILIDPTTDANVPMILANVRALGFDPRDIRLLLVTHAHWDHVGGAARMINETGAELRVSEPDAEFLRSGTDFGFESEGYTPAVVTTELVDGDEVNLGNIRLEALLTPGHTPGCTSWTGMVQIENEPKRFLLGCSLSALSQYVLSGDEPTYQGQAADFCRSLDRLRDMSVDVFLSNHGVFFDLSTKAENVRRGMSSAFDDPSELGRYLLDQETRINAELERQDLGAC